MAVYCFGEFELNEDSRGLRLAGNEIEVQPLVFDFLALLLRHQDRALSKAELLDALWPGVTVTEASLQRAASLARGILRQGGMESALRNLPRFGYRLCFNSPAASDEGASPGPAAAMTATADSPPKPPLRQEIRFCTASDGIRIAYAEVGAGPPLLKTANWLNHLESDWQSPIWSHLLHALAAEHRLIRYDARGNGLSDWHVDDISFDAFVRDLESVVEAAGLERFPLLGISQGCAVSVAYAVRHPERVSHLVLYGGFARGRRKRGSASEIEQADAVLTLMRHGWGRENPAFRQIFTTQFVPGGTPEQMRWFNDLQKNTASAENAIRIRLASENIDVVDLLPRVRVPTLVLHCRDDAAQPFEEGRRLAAGIPGAHFVALEGRNHLLLENDPGVSQFLDEVRRFLKTDQDGLDIDRTSEPATTGTTSGVSR